MSHHTLKCVLVSSEVASFVALIVPATRYIWVDVGACAIARVSDVTSELNRLSVAAIVAWSDKSTELAASRDVVCDLQVGALRALRHV